MSTITLQALGESVVMIMPQQILNMIRLEMGSQVDVELENGRLMLKPRTKPRYTLAELLAQCNEENMALTAEDRAWLDAKPVGKEVADERCAANESSGYSDKRSFG